MAIINAAQPAMASVLVIRMTVGMAGELASRLVERVRTISGKADRRMALPCRKAQRSRIVPGVGKRSGSGCRSVLHQYFLRHKSHQGS